MNVTKSLLTLITITIASTTVKAQSDFRVSYSHENNSLNNQSGITAGFNTIKELEIGVFSQGIVSDKTTLRNENFYNFKSETGLLFSGVYFAYPLINLRNFDLKIQARSGYSEATEGLRFSPGMQIEYFLSPVMGFGFGVIENNREPATSMKMILRIFNQKGRIAYAESNKKHGPREYMNDHKAFASWKVQKKLGKATREQTTFSWRD